MDRDEILQELREQLAAASWVKSVLEPAAPVDPVQIARERYAFEEGRRQAFETCIRLLERLLEASE